MLDHAVLGRERLHDGPPIALPREDAGDNSTINSSQFPKCLSNVLKLVYDRDINLSRVLCSALKSSAAMVEALSNGNVQRFQPISCRVIDSTAPYDLLISV
jgi:hypothetical protein